MTLALSCGATLPQAIILANYAAGVVVAKVGTVPISRQELLSAITAEESSAQSNKFCDLETAKKRIEEWRARGERIVFTNGCFDLLHVGHVSYLERARREGQRLVVGLNSDRSVRALKGESRPLIPERERAHVLAALISVDIVVIFDEETPLQLIEVFRPEVLAKGADYTESQVVGAEEVKSWGGKVVLVQLVEGLSTTNIVEKMVQMAEVKKLDGTK
jgi:D-beta-D-heptose 7-phosphate kinase/D-beta-D-heptose 1-phosphate adenosyltransferase